MSDERLSLAEAFAAIDAEQAALPMYAVKVTPGRIGWTAEANSHPGRLCGLVQPPSFWRPTRDGAVRAARRRIRRWERQDTRQARTEVVDS